MTMTTGSFVVRRVPVTDTSCYSLFAFAELVSSNSNLSLVMRKPAFCICENKDADQLRGNLCFRYTDSTIPLLSKSEISSLKASSVPAQPGLFQTWSETPKTGFLKTRLKLALYASYVILRISYNSNETMWVG